MYLSQLKLNPTHPGARRDLGDAYEMHRTLSRAFAVSANDPVPRFLWRLENASGPANGETILVQSGAPGCWNEWSPPHGYLVQAPLHKQINLEQWVVNGRTCRFRLRANPSVKRDGKRWGLHQEAEQLAWLQRQGPRHGFQLRGAEVSQRGRLQVCQCRGSKPITVDSVQYDGELVVADAARLRAALLAGVGPAKALGLGLLSLSRPVKIDPVGSGR